MRLVSLATLALTCLPLAAQEPQNIDQLAAKIAEIRKQRAELDKQEAELTTGVRSELKRIADLVERLGLDGPAPKPPAPPAPPTPVDPLKAKLKAAFDADPVQLDVRKGQALDLAALYKQAAALTSDPAVLTAGDLLTRVRDAAKALVGADALKGVRTVASTELGALLPTDTTLADDQRKAVAALFLKLSAFLEDIAK